MRFSKDITWPILQVLCDFHPKSRKVSHPRHQFHRSWARNSRLIVFSAIITPNLTKSHVSSEQWIDCMQCDYHPKSRKVLCRFRTVDWLYSVWLSPQISQSLVLVQNSRLIVFSVIITPKSREVSCGFRTVDGLCSVWLSPQLSQSLMSV